MPEVVVAIVGATGAVGLEILKCLKERNFPLSELKLFASTRSKGQKIIFGEKELVVEELTDQSFRGVNIAFFSAGSLVSKKFAPLAVKEGCIVIDNSSAFRMDENVPLVIPEINPESITKHSGIIANPNCSTIIGITPLWPIHIRNRIRRIIMSTYQAASGAGAVAIKELLDSTKSYLEGSEYRNVVFPHSYAFNLFSHNSKVCQKTGYNEEEIKIVKETRKIFGDQEILVSATCVRVPVIRAHSESISFECEKPISDKEVLELLKSAPGIKIVNNVESNYFPMPKDATGQYQILVGRVRQDISDLSGKSITLFVAGDQLLKGAAWNAVQIAELLKLFLSVRYKENKLAL